MLTRHRKAGRTLRPFDGVAVRTGMTGQVETLPGDWGASVRGLTARVGPAIGVRHVVAFGRIHTQGA